MFTDNIASGGIASRVLFELLGQYKQRPFIYVEPQGNFGDCLIYQGAKKLAGLAGLTYKTAGYQEFIHSRYSQDTVIYINGGGGFTPFWSGRAIRALKRALGIHQGVVILGPTTFYDQGILSDVFSRENMQKSSCERALIFARDETSYGWLKRYLENRFEVLLDHDTALNLCPADLVYGNFPGKYALYAVREDREAVDMPNKSGRLPLWLDPAKACGTLEEFIFLHGQAKEIITNRLHSAILGLIFGIPTRLFANNYHKNRSVWQFSLAPRGVKWIEAKDVVPGQGNFTRTPDIKVTGNNYLEGTGDHIIFDQSIFLKSDHVPQASVIIVTYNIKQPLMDNLEALKKQTFKDFEIFVIDNNEKIDLRGLIRGHPVNYIKLRKNYGICAARNIGIKLAQAGIIIFLDDDARPETNLVEEHLRAYQTLDILGLRGRILPRTGSIYNYLAGNYDLGKDIISCRINAEANCSFRKDFLFGIGGFNTNFKGSGILEGTELTYRGIKWCQKKDKFIYYPKVAAYHDYADSFVKYIRKKLCYIEHRKILENKYHDFSCFMESYGLLARDLNFKLPLWKKARLFFINGLARPIIMAKKKTI